MTRINVKDRETVLGWGVRIRMSDVHTAGQQDATRLCFKKAKRIESIGSQSRS